MSSAPYFKLYPSDFAGDTLHLSTEEMGAYFLLLIALWNAGGQLPNEPKLLARIARVSLRSWPPRWAALASFFEIKGGVIAHSRLTPEREKVSAISAERSASGVAGGNAKALKNKGTGLANASDLPAKNRGKRGGKKLAIPESIAIGDATASPSAGGAGGEADEVREAFDAWNRMAELCGLPKAEDLTDGRRKAIGARLKDGGLAKWRRALMACAVSPHCRGKNDRKWRADLDFVCQVKSFTRLLEGFYGTGEVVPRGAATPATPAAPAPKWTGPDDIAAEARHYDAEAWLNRSRWQDLPFKAVVAPSDTARAKLDWAIGDWLFRQGIKLIVEETKAA